MPKVNQITFERNHRILGFRQTPGRRFRTSVPALAVFFPWVLIFLGSIAPSSEGAILEIPTDYLTIQEGINAASDGDVIEVLPGTYIESIDFLGKRIIVRSRDGAATTFLQASLPGSTVRFTQGENRNTQLSGFTISGGTPAGTEGGVFCAISSPTIVGCVITNNTGSRFAAGLVSLFGAPLITTTLICGNQGTGSAAGGTYFRRSIPLLVDVMIDQNSATGTGAGGLMAIDQAKVELNRVEVTLNTAASGFGAGIRVCDSKLILNESTISNNDASGFPGGGLSLSSSSVDSTNSVVEGNLGSHGAGLFLGNSGFRILGMLVCDNIASEDGGGALILDPIDFEGELSSFSDESIFDRNDAVSGDGGGLLISGGSLNMSGVSFGENSAAAGRGGGIAIDSQSTLTLTQGDFTNNVAETGGAIATRGSTLILFDSLMSGNAAFERGGGLACEESDVTVDNCDFAANTSDETGGGIYLSNSTTQLTNSLIEGNMSILSGAGLYCVVDLSIQDRSMIGSEYSLSIIDSDFRLNSTFLGRGGGLYLNSVLEATLEGSFIDLNDCPSFDGGGLYARASTVSLTNCVATDNNFGGLVFEVSSTALVQSCRVENNFGFLGGGIKAKSSDLEVFESYVLDNIAAESGGGIYLIGANADIRNCLISGNSTRELDGGGIFSDTSDVTLRCDTIVGNLAGSLSGFGAGGGLFVIESVGGFDDEVNANSCIFWGNEARFGDELRDPQQKLTVTFSDVRNGWMGQGNLDEDPRLEPNGFHLLPGSPCINQGDPLVTDPSEVDIEGDPRVTFGRVDMGCEEFFALGKVGSPRSLGH